MQCCAPRPGQAHRTTATPCACPSCARPSHQPSHQHDQMPSHDHPPSRHPPSSSRLRFQRGPTQASRLAGKEGAGWARGPLVARSSTVLAGPAVLSLPLAWVRAWHTTSTAMAASRLETRDAHLGATALVLALQPCPPAAQRAARWSQAHEQDGAGTLRGRGDDANERELRHPRARG